MRFRGLAALPLIYAAAFIGIASWLTGSGALGGFVDAQLYLLRLLSLAGCVAAVTTFERGDHLRRAWLWLGSTAGLILLRDILRDVVADGGPTVEATVSGLGVAANLALLVGIFTLARAWKVAAVALPGGRLGTVVTVAAAAILALVVAGPSALEHAEGVAGGDWSALSLLASAVVDILSLCLLAPLLLTTVSLRGGLFAWPWGLITASIFSWLLYDAATTFGPAQLEGGFPLKDIFRGLALNFMAVAGFAQRLAVEHVRRAAR